MASAVLVGFWIVCSFVIAVIGLLQIYAKQLPQVVEDLLLYGKVRGKRKQWTFVQLIEVPKRWFIHFYILGSAVNLYAVYMLLCVYMLGLKPPEYITMVLKYLNPHPVESIGSASALLLVGMMAFQNVRRLLECLTVSVYSTATMNIFHYLLGIILYSTFHIAVLCEAPSLNNARVNDPYEDILSGRNIIALGLFVWASFHHNRSHAAFAALRKNKQGKVSNTGHHIPQGGWFELVSCPHYFMEILIYISFLLIGGISHHTLLSIILFVVANQTIAALLSHIWYRNNFKSYPKKRKAIFPYLL